MREVSRAKSQRKTGARARQGETSCRAARQFQPLRRRGAGRGGHKDQVKSMSCASGPAVACRWSKSFCAGCAPSRPLEARPRACPPPCPFSLRSRARRPNRRGRLGRDRRPRRARRPGLSLGRAPARPRRQGRGGRTGLRRRDGAAAQAGPTSQTFADIMSRVTARQAAPARLRTRPPPRPRLHPRLRVRAGAASGRGRVRGRGRFDRERPGGGRRAARGERRRSPALSPPRRSPARRPQPSRRRGRRLRLRVVFVQRLARRREKGGHRRGVDRHDRGGERLAAADRRRQPAERPGVDPLLRAVADPARDARG